MNTTTTSSRSGRHGSDILCAAPTNPTGLSTAHIGPHPQKPREIYLPWRVQIKALPTSPPLLGGLYLLSPSRTPLPRTGSVLIGVAEEASEIG